MTIAETATQTCSKPLHRLLVFGPTCSLPSQAHHIHSNGRFSWEDNNQMSANELTNFLLAIAKLPGSLVQSIQLNADGSVRVSNIDAFVQIAK